MKIKSWLAMSAVVCLFLAAKSAPAQNSDGVTIHPFIGPANALSQTSPQTTGTPSESGRIVGVLTDNSGAVIAGAKAQVVSLASQSIRSAVSSRKGEFVFDNIPPGTYQLAVTAPGFEAAVIHSISVAAGRDATADITLKVASTKTIVQVTSISDLPGAGIERQVELSDRERGRNTAEIVAESPGVSLRENGALATIPLLHGMGDERTRLIVDGMSISSACANHMNPSLSYFAPSRAAAIRIMAGITPVSLGGDSLGGTVVVDSQPPVFAKAGEDLHVEGDASGMYHSNGDSYGGSLSSWVAGHTLSMGYDGSWATGSNYTDGSGHKITSTYSQTTDHTLTLAAQGKGNLIAVQGGLHHTPYEGFPNAQMDLVRNYGESLNLHYRKSIEHGAFDGRVYWQGAWHTMDVGKDKSAFPMPMVMPMKTHGRDLGWSANLDLALSDRHTLQAGNELHRFVLDDRWPAVPGKAPGMGPDTFISINDGSRIRLAWFAQVASRWTPRWTTLLGLRNDTVWTNAGPVQGYSMMYAADANAFDALHRAHSDVDLDATALARYEPNPSSTFEFGYARKTRAPNLYERYAWSTNRMASGMIGWFGDGNYYVGSINLKPEIAHTFSGTASWLSRTGTAWELKLTPYASYIRDYVDVDQLATVKRGASTFAQLRFANHRAVIGGADLEAAGNLWETARFGAGRIGATAAWLHGQRLDTSTSLYQMMPLNTRITFDERLKGLSAGFDLSLIARKRNVDPHRLEQKTPGYALASLHTGYQKGFLRMNLTAENLLNKTYALPLGGLNYDDFLSSGRTSLIQPLTGRGRSFSAGLTARF